MQGVPLSYVEQLTPARDFWNMKARVIRVWDQGFRWDFILLDERGRKIQGCLKKHLVPDFQKELKEDAVLLIRKFGVGEQKDKHRVIPLDHKINFFKCTSISTVCGFEGHPYAFNFCSFTDINEGNTGQALTVDVRGRVAWCGDMDIFKSTEKESKRINFDLQDLDSNVVRCTLWGRYAEQFSSYIASNKSTEMVIVIIQHGKPKYWNDMRTVQNDMFATRLFINEDIQEANDFRRSMILKDGASSSQTVLSTQTVYPLRNEFLVKTPRKHVDEILDIGEESHCVVVATTRMIEEEHGWFYKACRPCQKKALTKSEYLEQSRELPSNFLAAPIDSLWCLKCKCMATSLVPKFKVQLRVQDSTGSISFVLFDKDVSKIVGLSAYDIRQRQIKSGELEVFPHELNALNNKYLAFKISVSQYNLDHKNYNAFTVSKICDDPELIEELEAADQQDLPIPEEAGPSCVRLEECSQVGMDSKDCASVTGGCLAIEAEKDTATSPSLKKRAPLVLDEKDSDPPSTARSVRKKLDASVDNKVDG